ncbi:hypothetical protein B0H10DRAFT_1946382 [Mycena sp. CBHHK59/15]|nr:hypothetical protein B0H10DRAFT_1946382 [Mycena sp. CBHHK59/15]
MQIINWKLSSVAQSPWSKFSVLFLILFMLYLLAHDAHPHPPKYHDLLSLNNSVHEGHHTSCLVWTLEGNERRYQFTVKEKEKFPPAFSLLYVLWDFFIPAFTFPFPMYHVGTLADGGKWVCGLECIIYNCPSPTVYSLGYQSPSYSSFEQDMLGQSTGCQVYAFNGNTTATAPLSWLWGDNKTDIDQNLASRVHFKYTIVDLTAKRYRSLQSVMGELGHDFVNFLKVIDLEGTEFTTLVSIITDSQENPLPFGQLLLEVHIRWSDDGSPDWSVQGSDRTTSNEPAVVYTKIWPDSGQFDGDRGKELGSSTGFAITPPNKQPRKNPQSSLL